MPTRPEYQERQTSGRRRRRLAGMQDDPLKPRLPGFESQEAVFRSSPASGAEKSPIPIPKDEPWWI